MMSDLTSVEKTNICLISKEDHISDIAEVISHTEHYQSDKHKNNSFSDYKSIVCCLIFREITVEYQLPENHISAAGTLCTNLPTEEKSFPIISSEEKNKRNFWNETFVDIEAITILLLLTATGVAVICKSTVFWGYFTGIILCAIGVICLGIGACALIEQIIIKIKKNG
ncbi:MAG: hypothetical protein IKB25_09370 [Lentisphaeria bacterium]|nr:hypothetical protein [Lentisphaeria bacterium]